MSETANVYFDEAGASWDVSEMTRDQLMAAVVRLGKALSAAPSQVVQSTASVWRYLEAPRPGDTITVSIGGRDGFGGWVDDQCGSLVSRG